MASGRGDQHVLGDAADVGVHRAAEDAGEAEDVVDRFAVGGEGRPGLAGRAGLDLGVGIGQGQDDLARADHGRLDQPGAPRSRR